jgi:glycosyltransferase involved in cell wall biosynthesis
MINVPSIPSIKSNSELPRVSIGLPTFNSKGNIRNTLDSIFSQGYSNLEIIISDNCSTDDTQETCLALSKNCNAIKYYRQPRNIGLMPNFEFVLRQATGDFFMWICDDDTLEPGMLNTYVDFLIKHPHYSLVSGQILYWLGERSLFAEKNFCMEQNSPAYRVIRYYLKVVYGGMYYGLMLRKFAAKIPLRNRIGDDWHFVASMAYQGKIKNLECIGYNKKLGGLSKNFKLYASVVEATWFSADFPRVKIALDAFSDIMYQSPVYRRVSIYSRFLLALTSCAGILIKYYFKEFPFIVGGRIKRFLLRAGKSRLEEFQKLKT